MILKAPKVAFKRELCTDIFQIYQNKLCFIISAQRLTMTKIRINSRYSNFLNNTISWVDKITMLLRYMLLKDKIVQMNTGFKGPKLVLLKERLGTQVFLLLNEINLVRMGLSKCLLDPSLQLRFKDCFSQGSKFCKYMKISP